MKKGLYGFIELSFVVAVLNLSAAHVSRHPKEVRLLNI